MKNIDRFVYFVQGEKTGLIKIGMTENMERRFKTIQASSPDDLEILALIKTNQGDGIYLRAFADYRIRGEWFRPTGELMSFLSNIPYCDNGVPFDLLLSWNRGRVGTPGKGGWVVVVVGNTVVTHHRHCYPLYNTLPHTHSQTQKRRIGEDSCL